MKIAYINVVYKEKSTGRILAELKRAHDKNGDDCRVFYGVGEKSSEAGVYKIETKFGYFIHNILSRITGFEGYFSFFSTLKLVRKLKKFNPDVISLHNLHGHYLNLPLLFKYLKKYDNPVFLTSHDFWMLTGKCTYFTALKCEKYMSACKNCSSRKYYPTSYFFDFSKKMYNDKKKWLLNIKNLNVITVSDWAKGEVEKSFLKDKNITTVHNWIDFEIFNKIDDDAKSLVRKNLKIGDNEFVIIAVSAHWKKETPRYQDLQKLIYKLKDNQKLVVVGLVQDQFDCADNVIFLSFVRDTKYLAKLYGMADAFVHFSVEDTFGKVIAEAQACGTPAIVYDSSACPEVAKIGNGFVVKARNVDAAYDIISNIESLSEEDRNSKKEERIKTSVKMLDKDDNIKKCFNLYKDALNNQQ